MQDIIIINPKGGCGKSTIAMNLAGFFACWGVTVGLVDLDPQGSCLDWLNARPETLPRIQGWPAIEASKRQASQLDYRIIDVPSSCFDTQIQSLMLGANTIIVPLLASINDFRATSKFLEELETLRNQLGHKTRIGFIANRIKYNTRSFNYLKDFIRETPISCRGILRDTQNYLRASENGLSIFEMPKRQVASDLAQWQRIVRWLCLDQTISIRVPTTQAENAEFAYKTA